jgi:hypothetical protein
MISSASFRRIPRHYTSVWLACDSLNGSCNLKKLEASNEDAFDKGVKMETYEILLVALVIGMLTADVILRLRFVPTRRRLWIVQLPKVLR